MPPKRLGNHRTDWDAGFNKLTTVLASTLGLRAKGPGDARSSRRNWLFAGIGILAAVIILAVNAVNNISSSSGAGGPSVVTPDSGVPSRRAAGPESSSVATAPSQLPGTWKADVSEDGVPTEINWQIRADGTSGYVFRTAIGSRTANTTWTYADGVISEESSTGPSSRASIKRIDRNHFVLTIIDNGNPGTTGSQRRYSRM